MRDAEDQIITSLSPEIEKDGLRAAAFVGILLALMMIGAPMIIMAFLVAGGPGAFVATAVFVASATAVATKWGPMV